MMLYTKYKGSGPCSFKQEDFLKLHFENLLFDPVTCLCNISEPLVGDHLVIIPIKFGQIPNSGLGEEVV